jgi:hypothetical protein
MTQRLISIEKWIFLAALGESRSWGQYLITGA